jgi:deoxyribodipyrimidine photo-lyase
MNSLVWFRNDLRLQDNPALLAARAGGAAYGLFIVSPEQWALHNDAPVKIDFWRRALLDLTPRLAKHGVALKLLRIERWSDVPQAILAFCQAHGIQSVHCNREQGVYERRRDRASFALLRENGINMLGHDGQTLFEPGSLKTGSGDTYRVFSPFARACRARLRASFHEPLPPPDELRLPDHVFADAIEEQWPESAVSLQTHWPADAQQVAQQLSDFVSQRVSDYHRLRDLPAQPGTSQLSPYLASGLISVRQCLQAALSFNHGEIETGNAGVVSWINELIWREFYWHLLHGYPKLSMHEPLKPETHGVAWRDAPEDFQAWTQARTGIPIVDAAMRQLLATGWMHNRLRMVVAMFLTKNLLIDWRAGERFFMMHLIDGELAANNGGWQWSASTGADAAPYFRVFNPVSQSQKFDPEGVFLRHWLPELRQLDNRSIHDPAAEQRASTGYPPAIVDLKSSRLRAIEAFKNLRPIKED